ncbi:InlB B-repeat-containing protein [Butyrivibrio sp. WCD2001]|uniref:InlB B-repeat-containing protein n=1 Tax=Butyrivibrio sp. WCD2001 TaxID=1280681 RepID=UPI000417A1DB|nr:InlB B-repeat-containing protein [Butyrivibrio sp. WCD2001]
MNKRFSNALTAVAGLMIGSTILTASGMGVHASEAVNFMQTEPEEVFITDNAGESEELLEGFMHKQAYSKSSVKTRNSKRRSTLSGVNVYIYDELKKSIEKIANGELASSKMTVSISLKDYFGDNWKDKYTPADFGLSSFRDSDGYLSAEVTKTLTGYLGYEPSKITKALRFDSPYEMYWFGNSTSHSTGFSCQIYGDGTTTWLELDEVQNYTFSFTVSANYSVSGEKDTFDVDTNKCKAVKTAAANANAIIRANAAKNDYEKLKAYNDAICELNTYNKQAAKDDSTPYGNPWQMIYVFDEDPTTNVVCEGYAKAFKYLCDGSTFENSLIECYIITGTMSDGKESEGHMWNHVRMDDGKIYLVDVTNCDSNSVGYPYKLFLAGGKKVGSTTWLKPNKVNVYYTCDTDTISTYSVTERTWSETDYNAADAQDAQKVTVTFDPNGGQLETNTRVVSAGINIGTLPTPTRTNYIFDGWYTEKTGGRQIGTAETFDADTTVYAHWTGVNVSVIYKNNDGTNNNTQKIVRYGEAYGTMPQITRTGYTLDGWYTEKDGGVKVTVDTVISNPNTHTLYAHWNANACTIIFDANGGQVGETSRNRNYDAQYGELPVPTRAYYSFDGWYDAPEGGKNVLDTYAVKGDITLYAHWKKIELTASFDSNDGSGKITRKAVTYGETYGELSVPSRTGYAFEGWYTSEQGGSRITADTIVSYSSDHTLYAHWKVNTYTVTFDANGGQAEEVSRTRNYGEAYGAFPEATNGYLKLEGWYDAREGGNQINISDKVKGDITLYAHWYELGLNATFVKNDGSGKTTIIRVIYGKPYGELPIVTNEGYTFEGWYIEDQGEPITADTLVLTDKSHKIYARWATIQEPQDENAEYSLSTIPNKSIRIFEKNTVEATLLKNGSVVQDLTDYRFEWGNYASDSGNYCEIKPLSQRQDSVVIEFFNKYSNADKGQFYLKVYEGTNPEPIATTKFTFFYKIYNMTVSFDYNGGTGSASPIHVTEGKPYGPLPTNAYREGCNFDGWFTAPDGGYEVTEDYVVGETQDHTLYAHWSWDVSKQQGQNQNQQQEQNRQADEPDANENGGQAQNNESQDRTPEEPVQDTIVAIDNNDQNAQLPEGGMVENGGNEYQLSESGTASVAAANDKNVTSVNIGSEVSYGGQTYKVTEIKSSAYKNCKKLKSVTIGSNIVKIGSNAFNGCKNLKNITIKANNLKSVGGGSFKGIKNGAKITVICKDKKTYNKIVKKLKKAGAKKAKFKFKKG